MRKITFTPQDIVFLQNQNIKTDDITRERLAEIDAAERDARRKLCKLGPRAVDRILDDIMALPAVKPMAAYLDDPEELQWDALVATVKNRDAAIQAALFWKRTAFVAWGFLLAVVLGVWWVVRP